MNLSSIFPARPAQNAKTGLARIVNGLLISSRRNGCSPGGRCRRPLQLRHAAAAAATAGAAASGLRATPPKAMAMASHPALRKTPYAQQARQRPRVQTRSTRSGLSEAAAAVAEGLPIAECLPEILRGLDASNCLVLQVRWATVVLRPRLRASPL